MAEWNNNDKCVINHPFQQHPLKNEPHDWM